MQTKKMDILTYLVELYKNFYAHKGLFKVNFKYSVCEVESFYEQMKNLSDTNISKKPNKEEKINDDILALKTSDDVKKYLFSNNQSKEDLLKKLNLDEFAYLYNIIFSSQLKSSMRKADALTAIEKYFNGLSRAISMKP
jgi:hypothetical protein